MHTCYSCGFCSMIGIWWRSCRMFSWYFSLPVIRWQHCRWWYVPEWTSIWTIIVCYKSILFADYISDLEVDKPVLLTIWKHLYFTHEAWYKFWPVIEECECMWFLWLRWISKHLSPCLQRHVDQVDSLTDVGYELICGDKKMHNIYIVG